MIHLTGVTQFDSPPTSKGAVADTMREAYEKQLQIAESFIARTNTAAFLWFASLIIIWSTGLLPSSIELSALRVQKAEMVSSEDFLSARTDAESLDFRLPGLEFPVGTKYAPTVWNWALVLLIWYVGSSRFNILERVAAAIRFKKENCIDSPTLFFTTAPWWLSPLPRGPHDHVSQAELREALGWGARHRYAHFFVIGFMIVLLLLQFHVAYMAWTASELFIRKGIGVTILPSLSTASLAATAFLFWGWLRERTIPAYLRSEEVADNPGRRSILVFSGIFLASIFVAPTALVLKVATRPKLPRYVQRRKSPRLQVDKAPGFWRNTGPKPPIIHVVTNDQTVYITGSIPNLNNFVKVFPNEFAGSTEKFSGAKGLVDLEQYCLEELGDGRMTAKEVIGILEAAIRYDRVASPPSTNLPSYRLYDLAAGLAVRHSPEQLGNIVRLAKNRNNQALDHRVAKWSDQASPWCLKWQNKDERVCWAGIAV